ncbi:YolD-like family protein [Paenibacillus rubinfantis]|uniref:YolD-like family protein n=1 Tax=Paenibacillus rubinfantis TaxID=1720296 RepID=UPI00073E3324|nr:YolD-like family protein [Paenibacillus rubinfantis]
MINDRGRIKWSPFLIPEHKKRIAQLYEAEDDVRQPELDEQHVEQLQETLSEAIEHGSAITVTYYADRRHRSIEGLIFKVDLLSGVLVLDCAGDRVRIRFDSLINVRIK